MGGAQGGMGEGEEGRAAMRVLVACEFSGIVRSAFRRMGHEAWSCDLLPADDRSDFHIQGDARDVLADGWDLLMVAHPPCTRLCNSGVLQPAVKQWACSEFTKREAVTS